MHSHFNSNDEIIPSPAELHQPNNVARNVNDEQEEPLLRQVDALQSKTSALPPEILSLIFQHASALRKANEVLVNEHPRDGPLFPVFLGSISRVWRQVAWSTPQLWTTLSLVISADRTRKSASLLDLYLTNVRGLPITLHIEFDYRYTPNLEDDPVYQVFFREENLGKLGALKLSQPPTSWLCLFDGPFSRLVEIHLDHSDKSTLPADVAFLTNAPMLKKISIERMYPPLKAPWSLITTLKLEDVSVAVALRCLLKCPNLVEFHYIYAASDILEDDNDEEHEEPPEMPNVLILQHLETLQWSFAPNHASDLFLRRIRLPLLRSLHWEHFTDTFPPEIWTFFQNLSSAPLTTLCLRGIFDMNMTLAKHIYSENPRIENLFLEDCDEETLYIALASLVPGWNGKGQADERRYLTRLRMLEIRGYVSGEEYPVYPVVEVLEASFGDIVVDLLIGRTSADFGSRLCINLVFNKMAKINWRPKAKEKLRELDRIDAGAQLLEDGKQMDWLWDSSHS